MLKKLVLAISFVLVFVMFVTTRSSAYSNSSDLIKGSVFKSEDGSWQYVIRVNEDGSFVTQTIEDNTSQAKSLIAKSSCSHTVLVTYGTAKIEKKSVKTESVCYKTRKYKKAKCDKCKKTGFRVYTTGWKKHKHDYGFLNLRDTCKECGMAK